MGGGSRSEPSPCKAAFDLTQAHLIAKPAALFCCPVTSRDFEPKARTSNACDWMPESEQRPARGFQAQRTSDPSRM